VRTRVSYLRIYSAPWPPALTEDADWVPDIYERFTGVVGLGSPRGTRGQG
jgi:hypothetical protein